MNNVITKSPYYKTTGISLLLNGALFVALGMILGASVTLNPPPHIVPVEIMPVKVENVMPEAAATPLPEPTPAPAPSPTPSPEPMQTPTLSPTPSPSPSEPEQQETRTESPKPREVQLPAQETAVQRESSTLPPASSGESSETSVAVPVPAGSGTEVHIGGSGAALAAFSGGNDSGGGSGGGSKSGGGGSGGGGGSADAYCTYKPKPAYPPGARRAGEEGIVHAELSIDETGAVTSVSLSASSGYADLDAAALRVMRQWHFSPKTRDGVPVACSRPAIVRFNLTDQD